MFSFLCPLSVSISLRFGLSKYNTLIREKALKDNDLGIQNNKIGRKLARNHKKGENAPHCSLKCRSGIHLETLPGSAPSSANPSVSAFKCSPFIHLLFLLGSWLCKQISGSITCMPLLSFSHCCLGREGSPAVSKRLIALNLFFFLFFCRDSTRGAEECVCMSVMVTWIKNSSHVVSMAVTDLHLMMWLTLYILPPAESFGKEICNLCFFINVVLCCGYRI